MLVKQIPRHVIEGRPNLRKSIKNLEIGKCIEVKSMSYARNVQSLLHKRGDGRFTTWVDESGKSHIGRIS